MRFLAPRDLNYFWHSKTRIPALANPSVNGCSCLHSLIPWSLTSSRSHLLLATGSSYVDVTNALPQGTLPVGFLACRVLGVLRRLAYRPEALDELQLMDTTSGSVERALGSR